VTATADLDADTRYAVRLDIGDGRELASEVVRVVGERIAPLERMVR
jgi:class 3 adenylate cyclase